MCFTRCEGGLKGDEREGGGGGRGTIIFGAGLSSSPPPPRLPPSQDKQASGESASTPASGGILPSESYAASRTLLDLAGVRTRQHAPATPLTLRVDPLGGAPPDGHAKTA